jgi:hypothetical protein
MVQIVQQDQEMCEVKIGQSEQETTSKVLDCVSLMRVELGLEKEICNIFNSRNFTSAFEICRILQNVHVIKQHKNLYLLQTKRCRHTE